MAMAKELGHVMKPWVEVAPALLDFFPWKYSNFPRLETIVEEVTEEYDEFDEDIEDDNHDDNNDDCYCQ